MKLYAFNGRRKLCGIQVKRRREELGISQEQLAARLQLLGLEISQKVVSRIETGLRVVPDYEVRFLAQALDTTVLWLLNAAL